MWRFKFTAPDGTIYDNRIEYKEISPYDRLAFHHGADKDDDPNRFYVTITFDEQQNKKTVLTLRQLHPSKERRDLGIGFGAVEFGFQTRRSRNSCARRKIMGKVKVTAFGVSLDGFGAGPNQSLENPLGERGPELHNWFFPTRTFQSMHAGSNEGTTGIDNRFAERSFENVGAWILGRNMFGPIRGEWLNDDWKGWWGEDPPYHVPIFVLTHHKREPLRMAGDNTFYFVTGHRH